jgi:uncharacterized protein (TIGR02145 family)
MSALKTWILFFCVVFLFVGCSDDSSPHKVLVEEMGDEDSSGNEGQSSKPDGKADSGKTAKPTSAETIVINGGKDTIYVADAEGSLYYSSGIFCWTEGCEKNFTSASSQETKPSSSSGTKPSGGSSSSSDKVSSSSVKSSSSQAPSISVDSTKPSVDKPGLKLTDNRDNEVYDLVKIGEGPGAVYWMAQNLRYKTSSQSYDYSFTKNVDGEDVVFTQDDYGRMYTHAAAQVACPSGWSLPTRQQTAAAIASQDHDWWTFSGRIDDSGKIGNLTQAYLWISGNMESGDENYGKYGNNPTDNALAFWVNGDADPGFIDNPKTRGYVVRCVAKE